MRMKAFNLKRIDKEYDMHLQAWLNHQVTATKNKGKEPAFKKLKDFYDYERKINEFEGKDQTKLTVQQRKMARLAVLANGKEVG